MLGHSVLTVCNLMDCNPPEFSRQEYWGELPFPPPENLPDPGIEPVALVSAGGSFTIHHMGSPAQPRPHANFLSPPANLKIFIQIQSSLLLFLVNRFTYLLPDGLGLRCCADASLAVQAEAALVAVSRF